MELTNQIVGAVVLLGFLWYFGYYGIYIYNKDRRREEETEREKRKTDPPSFTRR